MTTSGLQRPAVGAPDHRRWRALRLALGLAAATPLLYGAGLIVDPGLASVYVEQFSGGALEVTAELAYVGRVLGVYLFAFGLLLIGCLVDPVRMAPAIVGAGMLLIARGAQRLLHTAELLETFDIPAGRNLIVGTLTVAIGVVLVLLRPRPLRPRPLHPAPGRPTRPSSEAALTQPRSTS